MNDHASYTDHRLEAAKATGCRQASQRGWAFVPEEEKTPGFVWKFLAWAFFLTVFFVFTPILTRWLMS